MPKYFRTRSSEMSAHQIGLLASAEVTSHRNLLTCLSSNGSSDHSQTCYHCCCIGITNLENSASSTVALWYVWLIGSLFVFWPLLNWKRPWSPRRDGNGCRFARSPCLRSWCGLRLCRRSSDTVLLVLVQSQPMELPAKAVREWWRRHFL